MIIVVTLFISIICYIKYLSLWHDLYIFLQFMSFLSLQNGCRSNTGEAEQKGSDPVASSDGPGHRRTGCAPLPVWHPEPQQVPLPEQQHRPIIQLEDVDLLGQWCRMRKPPLSHVNKIKKIPRYRVPGKAIIYLSDILMTRYISSSIVCLRYSYFQDLLCRC